MDRLRELLSWMEENGWDEVDKNAIIAFMEIRQKKEIKRLTTEICIYKDLLYKLNFNEGSFDNKKILENFLNKDIDEFFNGTIDIPEKTTEVKKFLENLKEDKIK